MNNIPARKSPPKPLTKLKLPLPPPPKLTQPPHPKRPLSSPPELPLPHPPEQPLPEPPKLPSKEQDEPPSNKQPPVDDEVPLKKKGSMRIGVNIPPDNAPNLLDGNVHDDLLGSMDEGYVISVSL